MSTVQMRPTFLLTTEMELEETMQRIRDFVSVEPSKSSEFHGQFTRDHAVISIDESRRHFWSPWMHLEVREESGQRHIVGRFSPHPSIWTGFIFSYLLIGVLVFFALMFGVSQQLSNQSPWAYYCVPAGVLVAVTLWFASKAGQRLAHVEMEQMKSGLEKILSLTNEPA